MTLTQQARITLPLQNDRDPRVRESWAAHVVHETKAVQSRVDIDVNRSEQSGVAAELVLAKKVQVEVEGWLTDVRLEATRKNRLPSPVDSWTGRSIESAFGALHAAKLAALAICTQDELLALIPDALARIQRWLPTADPRRRVFEEFVANEPSSKPVSQQREVLRAALQVVYQRQDQAQRVARQFRNVLVATGGATTIFTAVLLLFVIQAPALVPFCFTPADGAAVCASGGSIPRWTDGLIVAGMGLLGGIFATTWTIRSMRPNGTPYGIPLALAILKVPCGALTALCAILLLHGQFVPGFTAVDTPQQILAYSLLFGFAQQAVTGAIDARAGELLEKTRPAANDKAS